MINGHALSPPLSFMDAELRPRLIRQSDRPAGCRPVLDRPQNRTFGASGSPVDGRKSRPVLAGFAPADQPAVRVAGLARWWISLAPEPGDRGTPDGQSSIPTGK